MSTLTLNQFSRCKVIAHSQIFTLFVMWFTNLSWMFSILTHTTRLLFFSFFLTQIIPPFLLSLSTLFFLYLSSSFSSSLPSFLFLVKFSPFFFFLLSLSSSNCHIFSFFFQLLYLLRSSFHNLLLKIIFENAYIAETRFTTTSRILTSLCRLSRQM